MNNPGLEFSFRGEKRAIILFIDRLLLLCLDPKVRKYDLLMDSDDESCELGL